MSAQSDVANKSEVAKRLCPFCRETVRPSAVKCGHCASFIGSARMANIDFECLDQCAYPIGKSVEEFCECAKACGFNCSTNTMGDMHLVTRLMMYGGD